MGQTIDNAELWASKLMSAIDSASQSLQYVISFIKEIGDKKPEEYCRCDSKYDTGKPICTTDCQYSQYQVEVPISTGEEVGTYLKWVCDCSIKPCDGNPCQQMMDTLSKVADYYKQLKMAYINFYISFLLEGRTDVLKQLTYSRQKTDKCSVEKSAYGNEARLLSCVRAEDEIIAPINTGEITEGDETIEGYCYGKDLGKVLKTPLTDNWFCCEKWQKEATTRKEPK